MTNTFGQLGEPILAVSDTRCRDEHDELDACSYRIAWAINPHMRPGEADPVRAIAQHRTLVTELRRAGATVVVLPFVHSAFDSVFVKDNALLLGGPEPIAVLSRFADHRRQAEQEARARAISELGFRVIASSPHPLEGGDLIRLADGTTFLGHGFRSSKQAAKSLEAVLSSEVVPLELIDPWLYHLDTALAALSDGTVLCCREAFTETSLALLQRHPSIERLVFVPRDEALKFALNFVEVGDTIVTGSTGPVTRALLEERGYRVQPVPLGEFQLAGGSAACLVARVYGAARVTRSDTSEMRSTSP